MGSDIFLSYSRADRPLAEQFVAAAKQHGVDVWFDENIAGGEDWRQAIVDELGSAKALVILFSDHSNASTQLIKELAIADKMNKRVIPVLVAETEPKGAYLYEMASRNWINIYPNPETRLASLVSTLVTQLELRAKGPLDNAATAKPARADSSVPLSLFTPDGAAPVVDDKPPDRAKATITTPPRQTPSIATPVPRLETPDEDGGWFPLRRYDLFVLVPILAISFLLGSNKNHETASVGFVLSMLTFFVYSVIVAVRNARLNRGLFSKSSFAGYFVVMLIGLTPALFDPTAPWGGLLIWVLILSVAANVLQVVLRKMFMQSVFRTKIERPLAK
jgi:hypothetical protein